LGCPWIFREILHFLATGRHLPPPEVGEIRRILLAHLDELYRFYGENVGVRIARKHVGWYTKGLADSAAFRHRVFQIPTASEQRAAVDAFLARCEASSPPRPHPADLAA